MRRIAVVQMASGPHVQANLLEAERHLAKAAEAGAELVVLPENFSQMPGNDSERVAAAELAGEGPVQTFLADQARRHSIWLVGGTLPLRSHESGRAFASCLVYAPDGAQMARYDKIHLFDVILEGTQESYHESATTLAGWQPVTVETDLGRVGLAICYDLRFPELFRRLMLEGAEIVALPAAFTAQTGKAHWEVLVRARAIENLSYIAAAGQGGFHVNGRSTYGHSMIVDPWGRVLTTCRRGAGIGDSVFDPDRLHQLRRTFPCLEHRRL